MAANMDTDTRMMVSRVSHPLQTGGAQQSSTTCFVLERNESISDHVNEDHETKQCNAENQANGYSCAYINPYKTKNGKEVLKDGEPVRDYSAENFNLVTWPCFGPAEEMGEAIGIDLGALPRSLYKYRDTRVPLGLRNALIEGFDAMHLL